MISTEEREKNKITPSLYRVVRLREQKISMERLRLERARFELDVADLVMNHIDKLKSSGVLQIEDRGEAAKKKTRVHVRQIHEGADRSGRAHERMKRAYVSIS